MSDAALQVRKAVIDKLKATAAVSDLVAGQIYTYPKTNASKPYIRLEGFVARSDKADSYDGSITDFQVSVYTAGPEEKSAMQIAQQVLLAIDGADLTLVDDFRLVEIKHDEPGTQYLEEEGGMTIHAAIPFTASAEPTGA